MAGSRESALEHLARTDLAALTREAAEMGGIPLITEIDHAEVDEVFGVT
jgi:hypothetical protein